MWSSFVFRAEKARVTTKTKEKSQKFFFSPWALLRLSEMQSSGNNHKHSFVFLFWLLYMFWIALMKLYSEQKRLWKCFLLAYKYLPNMNIMYFIVRWVGVTEKVFEVWKSMCFFWPGLHRSQVDCHQCPVEIFEPIQQLRKGGMMNCYELFCTGWRSPFSTKAKAEGKPLSPAVELQTEVFPWSLPHWPGLSHSGDLSGRHSQISVMWRNH